MKIKTPEDAYFLLPKTLLDKLPTANAAELKVLLYLYAWKDAEVKDFAPQLGLTVSEAEAAVAFWRGAGLIEADDSAPKKQLPQSTSLFKSYDSETIKEALDTQSAFKACCELVAEKLGKMLTKNDYSSLMYLCDYVGLPPEVVSGIAEYCVANGKKSMQYLMKTALGMYEQDGVDSYAKFEAYMAKKEQAKEGIGRVRKLCGMGERELSSKESAILNRWFAEWEIPFELVQLAFDKTVDGLGKVSLSYMNAMLKRWFENGFRTAEDVRNKDGKQAGSEEASYGDLDAFFEAALKAGMKE